VTEREHATRATAIGATAIGMWSSLAMLTMFVPSIPTLQLTAMAFTIGALVGVPIGMHQGVSLAAMLRLPGRVWLNGLYGLFGYHACYFLALRGAPVVEANLVNYLWPVLFLLFSALLPGETLRWRHGFGVALGFAGAALLITGGRGLQIEAQHLPGYFAALGCAVIWSSFSVFSRRFGDVPTAAIGGFCAATAALSWGLHFAFETTVAPAAREWLPLAILGLGPMGLAFFVWDHGVKRGRIGTLAAVSYFAPLLSTLLLVAAGRAAIGWQAAVACVLITTGALLAAGVFLRRGSADPPGADGRQG